MGAGHYGPPPGSRVTSIQNKLKKPGLTRPDFPWNFCKQLLGAKSVQKINRVDQGPYDTSYDTKKSWKIIFWTMIITDKKFGVNWINRKEMTT